MGQIPLAEMGDVSPAVQPGRSGDYGTATLSPTAPVEIRSFQTFRVTYTAGKFGLDDTGGIRIAFRFVQDGGPLQVDDPKAANHVTAECDGDAQVHLLVEPQPERPWMIAVRVTVVGGFIRPGETITVTFGDRAGGSPGWRMQTISEADFAFRVSVDACATGQFTPIEPLLSVPIIAGPAVLYCVIAPGVRRPGDSFALGVRAEDAWGNPAVLPDGLRVEADDGIIGLPDTLPPVTGAATTRLTCHAERDGVYTARLLNAEGNLLAQSNPIIIRNQEQQSFWGDLHGQSGETVGIGSIEEYMDFARDVAFLDVTSHQANDFQVTDAFWHKINALSAELDTPGAFVCYPGYEWSGNTPVGGDHNVFFRHEGRQIRRSSHAMMHDRSALETDANTLPELFEALANEDCVLWAHVGGRPADVSYAHDPKLRTAVEVHSNWGTFEWILADSLALGHRIGVVANSDGHKGRPGAGGPGATEFGAYGGLTCFLAPSLDRDAIFECLRRRHHYGTSGARMHLDVRAEFDSEATVFARDPAHFEVEGAPAREAMMGDIVATTQDRVKVAVSVIAGSPIERVDLMAGAGCVQTFRTFSPQDLGKRVRVYWQGAEYRGRGRNTRWQGSVDVTGGAIEKLTAVNLWNHERLFEQQGNRLVFDAVTSGNYAGADLVLSGDAPEIRVDTNLVEGTQALMEMGLDDVVLDAGGLERQIRLRRLPDALTETRLDAAAEVPVRPEGDTPIWVRVTTLDGHQAWSSPIYIVSERAQ